MPSEHDAAGGSLPTWVAARLVRHLRGHAEACADLGSPLYATLMARAADDLLAGGPVAQVFLGHHEDPVPAALALRLVGAVHRLVLTGQAPDLARYYPSVHATEALPVDPEATWSAFRAVLVARPGEVRAGLRTAPQTNEVGRAAVLIGGLAHLHARFDLPVRLVEIGASAGLNLRADHMRLLLGDGHAIGPADSPVLLADPWGGALPPREQSVRIIERYGSDPAPIDVGTAAGRVRLVSYVWPDQLRRLQRLRGAFELAAAVPAPVRAERAIDTVRAMTLRPGTLTVLWHSIMWQYLDDAERAGVETALDRLGAQASARAPLARLSLEPRGRHSPGGVEFVVRLRTWPGEGTQVLATAHPHGHTVTWRSEE